MGEEKKMNFLIHKRSITRPILLLITVFFSACAAPVAFEESYESAVMPEAMVSTAD